VRRPAEDRREDADAWLDHLADARQADDARVGLVGLGAGANLALRLAAWRAERIAAVAAFGARGFGPATAREIAQSINGVVRLGWPLEVFPGAVSQRGGTSRPRIRSGQSRGATSARIGVLETAFSAAGVDFDVEIRSPEPDWSGLIDLFGRTLAPHLREPAYLTDVHLTPRNP
jgi:pimeloyl-ACP methyl ester carboxylesterase